MTTACTNCVLLAKKVAELERQVQDLTLYAGQQHDRAAELTKQIVFLTTGRSSNEGDIGNYG